MRIDSFTLEIVLSLYLVSMAVALMEEFEMALSDSLICLYSPQSKDLSSTSSGSSLPPLVGWIKLDAMAISPLNLPSLVRLAS